MKHEWKKYILVCIWSPLFTAQFILLFFLNNADGYFIIRILGWLIWVISLILAWYPIFVLKRKGGVSKGKSYVNTTVIVDTGLYSIVRHPQYTAGLLFSLALALITQHWLMIILGVIIILLLYIDILMTDKYEIEKFGDDYKAYMKKVPRMNFIQGIFRRLGRNEKALNIYD